MKKINNNLVVVAVVASLVLGFTGPIVSLAATTPSLGTAATFSILSSTYTNTVVGTTINGDVGYTTGPALAPTVNGTTHVADGAYNQAGIDQGAALSNLNGQACTFTFAPGAIDLAADTTHGAIGVYTPGVYCTSGAASVGTAGLTLSGAGTYIFRINGALTTVANSVVTLAGGASACDVFWTPTSATTLGANSTFIGTNIDPSGITVGSTVTRIGRSLAFGGTITTNADTMTVPTCLAAAAPATLHIVKQVINNSGGIAIASLFNLHVRLSGADVAGSPALGVAAPGTVYSLTAGTYVVSEDTNASYIQSFGGACNSSGSVTLAPGDNVTCTVTNDDVAAVLVASSSPATITVIKTVINDNGGTRTAASFPLFVGSTAVISGIAQTFTAPATYTVTETGASNYIRTFSGACDSNGNITVSAGANAVCTITNNDIAPVVTPTPSLPNTGVPPAGGSIPWSPIVLGGILMLAIASLVAVAIVRLF